VHEGGRVSYTIALVGGDGAGKTTIAKELEASGDPIACRYLYMGQSVFSSDRALPTSRIARSMKRWWRSRAKRSASAAAGAGPGSRNADGMQKGQGPKVRNRVRIAASLANRIAEAAWRRMLVWRTTRTGLAVVSDRHFAFEAEVYAGEPKKGGPAFDRVERWAMRALGHPDLVLFLDAPPEVMYARKGETSVRRLTMRRASMIAIGARTPNFVTIDADRPYDEVLADVRAAIAAFVANGGRLPADAVGTVTP
jgi:thymidylate kinase